MVHSFYLLCLERCVLFRMSLFGSLFRLSERHMKPAVGFESVFNGLINLPARPVSVRWIDFFRCPGFLSQLGQSANQIGDVKRWYGGKLFHKFIDIGHPLLLVCCASHRKFRRNSVLARITDLIALFRSSLTDWMALSTRMNTFSAITLQMCYRYRQSRAHLTIPVRSRPISRPLQDGSDSNQGRPTRGG